MEDGKARLRLPSGAIPLLIVLLSAAIPWVWAPRFAVIAGIDTPPNVDFSVLFKTTLHTWDPAPNGGISNFVGYGMFFPYFLTGALLQSVGVSPHNITIGALSVAFALGALGFYLFSRLLGAGRPVCALLTLGYTFNFAHTFLAPGSAALFAYAALPWIPLAIAWAARSDRLKQIAIGLAFALASTGLIYIKINPPTYLALFIGGIVLGLLALRSRGFRVPLHMAVSFAVAFVAVNLWWISDFVLGVKIDPTSVTADLNMQNVSVASTLAQVLLLGGSWAFDPTFDASPYFSYAAWYRDGGTQFLLALAPAAAIGVLVAFRMKRAAMWTLAAVLWFVFLNAGYHPPFGWVFLWMFQHVPEFWLYREPLTKFDGILAMLYLCAFLFLIPQLLNVHHRRVAMGLLALSTIGFVVGGLPLATGAVVRPAIGTAPSFRVAVPAYWREFAKWANAQPGGRIAMLPQNAHYELLYDWGYLGADIDGMLLRHPFIDITPSAGYTDAGLKNVEMEWYNTLSRAQADASLLRTLSDALNVQYAVVRHDVRPTLLSPEFTPETRFLPRLQHIGFRQVARFGKLDVYERSCCVAVSTAVPVPVPLQYGDAMPAGAWYPKGYSNAIYVGSVPSAGVTRAAAGWKPSANFIFGLQGQRTDKRAGVRIWSALGPLQSVEFPVRPDDGAFVAVGDLIAPVQNGKTFPWHSEPRSFAVRGQILVGVPTHAPIVSHVPITSGGESSAGYGLLSIRPLGQSCSVVITDTTADPAHLIQGHQQQRVVPPYDDSVTVRVLLNALTTVTATSCSASDTQPLTAEVREYAIKSVNSFALEALPVHTAVPSQFGLHDMGLDRRTVSASCRCVLSYHVLKLAAPDFASVTASNGQPEKFVFGRIDSRGTVIPIDEATMPVPSLQRPVSSGNLVVGCYCGVGVTPNVRVELGAVALQHTATASEHVAAVQVAEASETGSNGAYEAAAPSELLLPESFSNGWHLTVDGKIVPHHSTLTNENAWVVPPGTHRYRLVFSLEDLGSRLQRVAQIAAVAALALILGIALFSVRTRRGES